MKKDKTDVGRVGLRLFRLTGVPRAASSSRAARSDAATLAPDFDSCIVATLSPLVQCANWPCKSAGLMIEVRRDRILRWTKYLLTLNCKHIANARELPRIYELLNREGMGQMLICTPAEFLGGDSDDHETTDTIDCSRVAVRVGYELNASCPPPVES